MVVLNLHEVQALADIAQQYGAKVPMFTLEPFRDHNDVGWVLVTVRIGTREHLYVLSPTGRAYRATQYLGLESKLKEQGAIARLPQVREASYA